MSTILMVGTRKGLWIGTSDDGRRDWELHRPALRHGGGLLLPDRQAWRTAPAAGRGVVLWLGPAGPMVRRPRCLVAGDPERRRPLPGGHRRQGRAGLAAGRRAPRTTWCTPAPSPGRSASPPTAASPSPSSRHCGTTRTARSGTRVSAARPSTRSCRTRPTRSRSPPRSRPAASTRPATAEPPGSRATRGSGPSSCPEGQQYPEFGQCVHKVTRHPSRPERLFLQNHGGVYRSDNHGETWESIADGLPVEFGFAIVVHPHQPDTVYVFPINGGDGRYPPDAKARVWRSRDAGESWKELGQGLPDTFFVGVMRDAMCVDDHATPRGLLRRPQRCRLGVGRRGRHLAADRQRPARRDGGPGGIDLAD